MITTRTCKFESGALSIVQMGEELIGHPSTALNELVKNAYDADALMSKVYIHVDSNPLSSFLLVLDNGIGMNENILFGEWLQTSKSKKRFGDRKSEKFKRSFLGSKGIGRFAAMALGKYVTVVSKRKEDDLFNWVSLDRQDFRQEELLSSITFPGGQTDKIEGLFSSGKTKGGIQSIHFPAVLKAVLKDKILHGTLLVIEELDESILTIQQEEFKDKDISLEKTSLMMSLRSLITPLSINKNIQEELLERKIIDEKYYHAQAGDNFSVFFGTNLFAREKDDIDSSIMLVEPLDILKHFDYRLIGKVNENGNVTGHYSCKRLNEDKIEEAVKLDRSFVLADEPLRPRKFKETEKIPAEIAEAKTGEFFFDMRVYDRDMDALEKMTKLLKQDSITETRKLMDKLIRFRVSKNHFGVKPYGEEIMDWMSLGQMRVQQTTAIGPNQILGYVILFSPVNDGLTEKTNREGFFENKAFYDLKKIIRAIVIELGRKRLHYRLKHGLGRTLKSNLERPDTAAYLNFLVSKTDNRQLIVKAEEFVQGITTTLDNMENALSFSERLATLGSGLELVYHELAQPVDALGGVEYSLELKTKKLESKELREKYFKDIKNINASVSALDTLKESLQPAIGKAKPNIFRPLDIFKKVCVLFTQDIHDYNIELSSSGSLSNHEIDDYQYALWIAFLNIINNAVYWLKRSDEAKKIHFSLEANNTLVLANTGPKIPTDALEIIFEYGVTMKPEKNATGLGLTFTRNILRKNDWEIWAENRKAGPAFLVRKVGEK